MRRGAIAIAVVVGIVVISGFSCVSSYNKLVALDQGVTAQWAQVQNVYQRRADLVPNLVETVKGAAAFERDTLVQVTEARAQVGQMKVDENVLKDPQAFQKFQEAQGGLSSALSRLLVVSEKYPELRATQAFRDLQAQLEGTENRITVERQRFNDVSREYNTRRSSFPTVLLAGMFGSKFAERPYFQATSGAETPPQVKF